MQSQDSSSHQRTTSKVPEPRPGAAERAPLHVAAPPPREQAGAVLEERRPIADPSERPPV